MSFLICTPGAAFADPVVETLIQERGARPRKGNKEGVRFKVVRHVVGAGPCMLGAPDRWALVDLRNSRQQASPPGRQKVYGWTRVESWLETDVPCDHNVLSVEMLKPDLARSCPWKKRSWIWLSIEVTVLVKRCENGDIASGERA